jgi:hypothetical protein
MRKGEVAEAQAWRVAAHDAPCSQLIPPTEKKAPLAGRAVFVHVLGQLAELFCCHTQCLGGMSTDCRHHFVVQVSDDFLFFAFQFLGCSAKFDVQLAAKILESRLCLGIVL